MQHLLFSAFSQPFTLSHPSFHSIFFLLVLSIHRVTITNLLPFWTPTTSLELRMMRDEAHTNPTSSDPHQTLRLLDLFIRLIVLPLTAASIWVMVKNNQVNDSYGKLEFSNLTGLKYLVWINAISAGYAFASILFSYLRWFNSDWVFFVLDQVTAYLMVTSGSAVVEILYLAHEGDRDVSWSEVCNYYGKFCSRAKVSLAFHFMALVCFLALSLISANRVFSKFEAPSIPSKEVGGEGE